MSGIVADFSTKFTAVTGEYNNNNNNNLIYIAPACRMTSEALEDDFRGAGATYPTDFITITYVVQ